MILLLHVLLGFAPLIFTAPNVIMVIIYSAFGGAPELKPCLKLGGTKDNFSIR